MPKFISLLKVTVTETYIVEANSMEEAFEKAYYGDGTLMKTEQGESEVLEEASRNRNSIKYAVEGHIEGYGKVREGPFCETWQEALKLYMWNYPERNKDMEVLVLNMAVNGGDPVPVWEQAFFDHIEDQEIQVRSVRDPRDPSDQLTKG